MVEQVVAWRHASEHFPHGPRRIRLVAWLGAAWSGAANRLVYAQGLHHLGLPDEPRAKRVCRRFNHV